MLVSSRGRYAIRVMIDLAEQEQQGFVPLKVIAQRQGLSEKYLESILSVLTRAGLLQGHRGKGGGYMLTKPPQEYTVGSILKLTEESLSPVSCLQQKPNKCTRVKQCRTLPMWEKLDSMIDDFFEGISIAQLVNKDEDIGYCSLNEREEA